jgi:hypothetical protein
VGKGLFLPPQKCKQRTTQPDHRWTWLLVFKGHCSNLVTPFRSQSWHQMLPLWVTLNKIQIKP